VKDASTSPCEVSIVVAMRVGHVDGDDQLVECDASALGSTAIGGMVYASAQVHGDPGSDLAVGARVTSSAWMSATRNTEVRLS
jgi:hypothetical protein